MFPWCTCKASQSGNYYTLEPVRSDGDNILTCAEPGNQKAINLCELFEDTQICTEGATCLRETMLQHCVDTTMAPIPDFFSKSSKRRERIKHRQKLFRQQEELYRLRMNSESAIKQYADCPATSISISCFDENPKKCSRSLTEKFTTARQKFGESEFSFKIKKQHQCEPKVLKKIIIPDSFNEIENVPNLKEMRLDEGNSKDIVVSILNYPQASQVLNKSVETSTVLSEIKESTTISEIYCSEISDLNRNGKEYHRANNKNTTMSTIEEELQSSDENSCYLSDINKLPIIIDKDALLQSQDVIQKANEKFANKKCIKQFVLNDNHFEGKIISVGNIDTVIADEKPRFSAAEFGELGQQTYTKLKIKPRIAPKPITCKPVFKINSNLQKLVRNLESQLSCEIESVLSSGDTQIDDQKFGKEDKNPFNHIDESQHLVDSPQSVDLTVCHNKEFTCDYETVKVKSNDKMYIDRHKEKEISKTVGKDDQLALSKTIDNPENLKEIQNITYSTKFRKSLNELKEFYDSIITDFEENNRKSMEITTNQQNTQSTRNVLAEPNITSISKLKPLFEDDETPSLTAPDSLKYIQSVRRVPKSTVVDTNVSNINIFDTTTNPVSTVGYVELLKDDTKVACENDTIKLTNRAHQQCSVTSQINNDNNFKRIQKTFKQHPFFSKTSKVHKFQQKVSGDKNKHKNIQAQANDPINSKFVASRVENSNDKTLKSIDSFLRIEEIDNIKERMQHSDISCSKIDCTKYTANKFLNEISEHKLAEEMSTIRRSFYFFPDGNCDAISAQSNVVNSNKFIGLDHFNMSCITVDSLSAMPITSVIPISNHNFISEIPLDYQESANEPVFSAMFFTRPSKSFLHSSKAPKFPPPRPPPKPSRQRKIPELRFETEAGSAQWSKHDSSGIDKDNSDDEISEKESYNDANIEPYRPGRSIFDYSLTENVFRSHSCKPDNLFIQPHEAKYTISKFETDFNDDNFKSPLPNTYSQNKIEVASEGKTQKLTSTSNDLFDEVPSLSLETHENTKNDTNTSDNVKELCTDESYFIFMSEVPSIPLMDVNQPNRFFRPLEKPVNEEKTVKTKPINLKSERRKRSKMKWSKKLKHKNTNVNKKLVRPKSVDSYTNQGKSTRRARNETTSPSSSLAKKYSCCCCLCSHRKKIQCNPSRFSYKDQRNITENSKTYMKTSRSPQIQHVSNALTAKVSA